jgi:hypothetical protein
LKKDEPIRSLEELMMAASETNQKRKREAIRSYVTKYVLPRHEDTEEEDAVTHTVDHSH